MSSVSSYTVIPNFNAKDLLRTCLDSLDKQSLQTHIVVVDNGSSDGSQELIEKSYPNVELIKLDKNHGFSGGVNPGIMAAIQAGVPYVALLNNDAIADKHWLRSLVSTAEQHPKTGIVTSKILRSDSKHIDSTGDFFTIWGLPFPRGRNEVDEGQYDDKNIVFGGSGGATLYRVKMLKQIGLFDEDFFAYFEDVDISFRAQLAGWKARYEPKAVVLHHLSATSSKMGDFSLYHSSKNFLMLYAKNMPTKLYLKYLPLFFLQYSRWFMTSLLRGKIVTFLKGTFAAVRLSPQVIKKRRIIQKSRAVPVSYINGVLYHHRPPKPPKI